MPMAPLIAQLVKNLPAMKKTLVQFLGLEDPLGEEIGYPLQYSWTSPMAQLVKKSACNAKTWVPSLGREDPLEKGKATHCSILAWRIARTV